MGAKSSFTTVCAFGSVLPIRLPTRLIGWNLPLRAMMTVVSIVLAILLMTRMLASTQFSPRILVNLRLMRALSNPVIRGRLLERGNRVIGACAGQIQEFDLKRLRARLALLEFELL